MSTASNGPPKENVETFTFVWLDRLVNTSQDNIDTQELLRKVVNPLKTFEDADQCMEYIRSRSQKQIVLIVSGRVGQEVVPHIHQFPQLMSIYVYCSDVERNEKWAKNFPKVKGIINVLNDLITRIQLESTRRNEYKIDTSLPISVFHTKSQQKQPLLKNNEQFIYLQLLIDCLSRLDSSSNEKNEFLTFCEDAYKGNQAELSILQEFQRKYTADRAIWWYTRESCVSQLLNKAFQERNLDLLFFCHFFIRDIRQQIKDNKCSFPVTTYRAQLMSNEEIQIFKKSIGELISIDTFFATIPNQQRALSMLQKTDEPAHMNRVLFRIDANPALSGVKPFCDIASLNYLTGVETILFMAGSTFHPVDICIENGVIVIQMEAASDNEQKLKPYLDNFKTECYSGGPNLLSLGLILLKLKKMDNAEKSFDRFLSEMPNDHFAIARCHRELGNIAMEKHDYDLSLERHQKALEIYERTLRSSDPEIAACYNTIANVYVKKGEYSEAFELYTKALQIWIRTLGKDHLKVAICYKGIGSVYESQNKYSEALNYYQKALEIRGRHLPVDYPEFGRLYSSIASVYGCLGDNNQAMKHYKTALKIFMDFHPDHHSDIVAIYRSIGFVYEAAGQFYQALNHYEKAMAIRRQLLPSNHPDIIEIEEDMKRVSEQLH